MIEITEKSRCCGCSACISICPKQCITMYEDEEGFLYPKADKHLCINCGQCESVCPVIHQEAPKIPIVTYAAINPCETVRIKSSSGGIFTRLAEQVLDEGGAVFGAAFDKDWSVKHIAVTCREGLAGLRGSKYLQSRMESTFKEAENYLKAGRKVLFSGTSCQIAGLKRFLHKEYGNLLAVDVICHGVPSPKAWQDYLAEKYNGLTISDICFRDKRSGWKQYSQTVTSSTSSFSSKYFENDFMNAFLMNLTLRPSCYDCPAKKGKSTADLTLGDFWGVERLLPQMDDDKGTSLVIIYTDKGKASLLDSDCTEVPYQDAVRYNPSIENPVAEPVNRRYFFHLLGRKGFQKAWDNTRSNRWLKRVERKLFRML